MEESQCVLIQCLLGPVLPQVLETVVTKAVLGLQELLV